MPDNVPEGTTDEQRVKLEIFNKLFDESDVDKKEQSYKKRLKSKQMETNLRERADQVKAEREMLEMFKAGYKHKQSKWYNFNISPNRVLNSITIFAFFFLIIFSALVLFDSLFFFIGWVSEYFSSGMVQRADARIEEKIMEMYSQGYSSVIIEKILYSVFISSFIVIINWFSE